MKHSPSRVVIGCLTVLALLALGSVPARAATACPPAGGVGTADAPAPTTGVLIVQGHGWGHSLGMSQYGAQGAARLGCSAATILSTYYTGTSLAQQALRPTVTLRLLRDEPAGRSTVQALVGTLTWVAASANMSVVQPQGETWTVQRRADGKGIVLLDATGAQRFWINTGGVLRLQERGNVARVRSFGGAGGTTLRTDLQLRWDDTVFSSSSLGLSVNQVLRDDASASAVQKYLWGLAEVPVSWPAAALQAQAIAARTYLVAGYGDPNDSSNYTIGTTSATQNYGGYRQESLDQAYGGAWRAAVDATNRQVIVTPDGLPINAVYSSSAGGRTEDVRYVWGGPAVSYLQSVDDSQWDAASDNPFRSWAAGFAADDAARRFGFDSILGVTLGAPGTDQRLAGVSVTGLVAGVPTTRTFTGSAARAALGVRSPSFSLRWLVPANSQPLAGDFDGDGRGDVGWYTDGRVTLLTASGARRTYALGRAGDRAVVGDWDGNGKDSVGVVDGNTWCLRNLVNSGPCDMRFRYGAATDWPVAGRWHGGKVDGIGVWRGGKWLLRDTPGGGSAQFAFAWGRSSDVPIVGDWDGNGTDTQGVVRGNQWYVANRLGTGVAHASMFVYGKTTDRFVTGTWAGGRYSYPSTVAGNVFYQRFALSAGPVTKRVTLAP